MNSFLTVDQVLSSVLTVAPEASQKDKNIFKHWIFLAERQIGSSIVSRKNAVDLVVSDFSFAKPFDCIRVENLALFDSAGKEVRFKYYGRGQQMSDRNLDSSDVTKQVIVREDDGFMYLSSNGSNVVKANIRYTGFPTDENENLKIPEIHLLAIMSFVRYMLAMRDKEQRLQIREFANIWEKEKREARARTAMPSELEAEFIARRFSSMIDKLIKDY